MELTCPAVLLLELLAGDGDMELFGVELFLVGVHAYGLGVAGVLEDGGAGGMCLCGYSKQVTPPNFTAQSAVAGLM